MANPIGNCHVCGAWGPLTFEHVPPISAGNEPYGIELDVSQYLLENAEAPLSSIRRKKLPRGSGGYCLCASCNNNTGGWYAPKYTSWAFQGERHRAALADTNSLALPFRIFPNEVFKQILTIFAATCNYEMFETNQSLRKLVLDRDAIGMPEDLRLFCYFVHPESHYSRHSGVAGLLSGSTIHTFAEFAFRPFGYILTFDNTTPPDKDLFDITFFACDRRAQYRELHLPIPVRHVESYFPADFRSKKQWAVANEMKTPQP